MSKQFIKTENGLEQVAKPLVKVYDTMDDFLTALPNLEENEIVTTEFTGGTEDVMFNFEELSKLAIDYSDGVIVAKKNVNKDLIKYAKSNHVPLLAYPGEDFADAYDKFYEKI